MSQPKRILVLCTGNRCRSQMAEGWLRHFGGDRIEVFSAGTQPKGLHPLAVQVMCEAGVDIGTHKSDHVDQYVNEPFDCVITVCDSAREACPTFSGARHTMHQSFDDPDAATGTDDDVLAVFRRVRDEIRDWAERIIQK